VGELSREDYDLLLSEELRTAAEARESLDVFMEYVLREEKTNGLIRLAPHQRVLNKFLLEHERCCILLPVGHGKTSALISYTLMSLGLDPLMRGAIVSATQQQAEKVVMSVRDYVDNSPELHLVFPELRRHHDEGMPWTQTKIVVERPLGIKDPSLVAVGMDGALEGSRLNWVIIDDLLKADNTRTRDACFKVREWVRGPSVMGRLDPSTSKMIISNTPWARDDLIVSAVEDEGWACLKMSADGYITVRDDAESVRVARELGRPYELWDSDELRPAVETDDEKNPLYDACRLVAHDPDPDGETPLWPERATREFLQGERRRMGLQGYLQSYMCEYRDEDTAWCKKDWVDACKALAREPESDLRRVLPGAKPYRAMLKSWRGPYQAFTGVDLAFSERASADDTAFFTFCVLPTGHRLVLDVDIGKWNAPTVARKIAEKHERFGSIITVEDVAAQKGVVDLLRKVKATVGIPIKGFTTTAGKKSSIENGLPTIFTEIEAELWVIPNDFGVCEEPVQKWLDGLLDYSPSKHTPDALMAMFFARDRARQFGLLSGATNQGMLDLDFVSR